MVKDEIYTNEVNIHPTEKKIVNQQFGFLVQTTDLVSKDKEVVKSADCRFVRMKKIRRTKSGGIF
ncbi:MAG: hypothetical protein M3Q33_13955 [Acidobacteriota bacterium]|nr:hypothetical protein [Acidobacteriota bacterium]